MDQLPVPDAVVDVVIAHGIWNLAHSDEEFRAGIADAARVLKPGGALFLSTFSRHTIPPDARAVLPNRFTFTQFSGSAQCFVTERELYGELEAAGLAPDPAMPLVEHNRPAHAHLRVRNSPVILEGGFRRVGPR
jgi:ubiquinone/menaquinone biosynthesis C-methylase UbiE